jgi:hypothetical protein
MPADEPELRTLKVLYLHGYEEQVTGKDISPKVKSLMDRADLDVLAPELQVWVTSWNSPLLQLLAVPYVHFAIFCAICVGELVIQHGVLTPDRGLRLSLSVLPPAQWLANETGVDVPWFLEDMWVPPVLWLGLGIIILVMLIFRGEIMTAAVDRSVAASYAIAKHALASHKPDVVVGYDWGGGLVFNLLREGVWDGPTVMAAPTNTMLFYKQSERNPEMWHLQLKRPQQVLCVHAEDDEINAFATAKLMYEANKFTIEPVSWPRHDLMILSKEGRLANMCRAVHQIGENLKEAGDNEDDDEVEQQGQKEEEDGVAKQEGESGTAAEPEGAEEDEDELQDYTKLS